MAESILDAACVSLKFRDSTELSFRGSNRNEYFRAVCRDLFWASPTSDGLGHSRLSWETALWFESPRQFQNRRPARIAGSVSAHNPSVGMYSRPG